MTRYAIADIHGGNRTLRALLNRIGLQQEDRVYLLGDYVDRGADSKGVLDTIICLQEIGFDIRPIRGNHDDLLLRTITGKHDNFSRHYMDNWGFDTLLSFGVMAPADVPEEYRQFLEGLPYLLEDGNFIFVHASFDMTVDNPLTGTADEIMLWGNGPFPVLVEIPGKTIISGHKLRTVEQIKESLTMPYIQLDNGAFTNEQPGYGNLVALNLDSMELTLQPWLDGEAQK
jgi:serine/threonine protein phosphatase 1